MQLIKRWSTYLVVFIAAMLVTDEYREYRQLKEFDQVRKEIIMQEQQYERQQKNCLKNALYYEARSEGKLGILAVASVIENRKNSARYPNEYCSVIKQHKQFSYTLEGKPDVEAIEGHLKASDRAAYAQVSDVANKMLDGRFEPLLPSNVLWYAKDSVRNYWTKTKTVATRVGQHVFYKEKQKK